MITGGSVALQHRVTDSYDGLGSCIRRFRLRDAQQHALQKLGSLQPSRRDGYRVVVHASNGAPRSRGSDARRGAQPPASTLVRLSGGGARVALCDESAVASNDGYAYGKQRARDEGDRSGRPSIDRRMNVQRARAPHSGRLHRYG